MKCPVILKIIVCVLVSVGLSGQLCFAEEAEEDDDNCSSKTADTCFRDVSDNLDCHFNSKPGRDCNKKDAEDLCSAIDAALTCSSDFMNQGCKNYSGSKRFDTWLQGLQTVSDSLCSGNRAAMTELLNNKRCWSFNLFITCVKNNINVSHVVDMLATDWDFIGTVIAMANCNAIVTSTADNCTSTGTVMKAIMHSFFSTHGCEGSYASSGLQLAPSWFIYATLIYETLF